MGKRINKKKSNALTKTSKNPKSSKPSTTHKSIESLEILHRDSQRQKILNWVADNQDAKETPFFYIFGPPGTGKTILIQSLMKLNFAVKNDGTTCQYINCMSIPTSNGLIQKIKNFINTKNNSIKLILILDEIQQSAIPLLIDAFSKARNLLIIGISNCLSPHNLISAENTLAFPPYTSTEILDILKNKFKDFEDSLILELISKKIAGTCGDLRQAFCLTKSVYESTFELKECPKERRVRMMSIVCPSNKSASIADDSMPFQQKIIACALIMTKEQRTTLGKLYDQYGNICKGKKLPKIDFSTFCSSCELMASTGLVRVNSVGKIASSNISFGVDVGEIRRVLVTNEILGSIVNE